jgi:hypothetical protein
MKRRVAFRRHKVPFVPAKHIEDEAQLLLAQWAQEHGAITAPPVPIEDILELHLGLTFEISELKTELGHPDVLGGIWFGEGLIKVDQSLDPSAEPRLLGRYRFTLAHEVGHWQLHRRHLMQDPSARSLFESGGGPAFVQRSSDSPPEEIQANAFAAAVLMPRQMVFDAWCQWRGSQAPVSVSQLEVSAYHTDPKANEEMAMEKFCKPLAEKFEVSAQAMRIRLAQMDLLVRQAQPRLF